jgi:hypothetical protein
VRASHFCASFLPLWDCERLQGYHVPGRAHAPYRNGRKSFPGHCHHDQPQQGDSVVARLSIVGRAWTCIGLIITASPDPGVFITMAHRFLGETLINGGRCSSRVQLPAGFCIASILVFGVVFVLDRWVLLSIVLVGLLLPTLLLRLADAGEIASNSAAK